MLFVFEKIDKAAETYVAAKLGAMKEYAAGASSRIADETIINAISQQETDMPVLATEEQFFEINKKQAVLVEVAKRCAIQELVVKSPLVEGEELEEDFFSYITAPYHDVPAFTGALRRTTNRSVMIYLFRDTIIDTGNVVKAVSPATPPRLMAAKLTASFTITESMVKGMLTKAAGAVFSKLGAVVLNLVMQELFGGQDDTAKMIEEIKRVVREEIEANELAKMEGTVSGTLQFLSIEYKNMKNKADLNNTEDRKMLTNSLKPYNEKFYMDIIGTLQQEKYAQRGMRTFLIATAVHTLIIQELAMVDPGEKDANNSSYAITLRENAKLYRTHVETTYNKIIADRTNAVELKNYLWVDCMGNSCVRESQDYWYDNVTKEESRRYTTKKGDEKPGIVRCKENMQEHINYVLTQKRADVGNPETTYLPNIKEMEIYKFPK